MKKQELSLEQVAGKFAGFVNYIKDKSDEDIAEALSKQPEYIVSMYNAINEKEEQSFSFESNISNSDTSPKEEYFSSKEEEPASIVETQEKTPPVIDKEELYKEFISRYNQEINTKTLEETKSEASKIAGDFFSQYTDQEQKNKDIILVRKYVAGSVANGDDYVKATKDALELISPKQIQVRGSELPSQQPVVDFSKMSLNEKIKFNQLEAMKKW